MKGSGSLKDPQCEKNFGRTGATCGAEIIESWGFWGFRGSEVQDAIDGVIVRVAFWQGADCVKDPS